MPGSPKFGNIPFFGYLIFPPLPLHRVMRHHVGSRFFFCGLTPNMIPSISKDALTPDGGIAISCFLCFAIHTSFRTWGTLAYSATKSKVTSNLGHGTLNMYTGSSPSCSLIIGNLAAKSKLAPPEGRLNFGSRKIKIIMMMFRGPNPGMDGNEGSDGIFKLGKSGILNAGSSNFGRVSDGGLKSGMLRSIFGTSGRDGGDGSDGGDGGDRAGRSGRFGSFGNVGNDSFGRGGKFGSCGMSGRSGHRGAKLMLGRPGAPMSALTCGTLAANLPLMLGGPGGPTLPHGALKLPPM